MKSTAFAVDFVIAMAMSLCACGNETANEPETSTETAVVSTETVVSTEASESKQATDSQETSYVGTWVYKEETSQGPFVMTLVINEDGTATRTVGKNVKNYVWYVDEASDTVEGSIEIADEDKVGYGNDAYIMEDGKLYYEVNYKILDNSYDHLIFERQ